MEPKKIATNYLESWFVLDFFTSLPIAWFVSVASDGETDQQGHHGYMQLPRVVRIVKIARLMKVLRVFKLMRTMSQWEDQNTAVPTKVFKLVRLLVTLFVLTHLCACGLMGIASLERAQTPDGNYRAVSWVCNWAGCLNEDGTWVDPLPAFGDGHARDFDTLLHRYLVAFHWSLMTLTTVGYGDVGTQSRAELSWMILTMLVGACSFGYIIGSMTSLIAHEDEAEAMIRDKITSLNAYMEHRKLPKPLVKRIRNHYEFTWKRTTVWDEHEILAELPDGLRASVALFLNGEIISKVPFLRDLQKDARSMLVQALEPVSIGAGEEVVTEGHFAGEMYFVCEGEMQMIVTVKLHNKAQLARAKTTRKMSVGAPAADGGAGGAGGPSMRPSPLGAVGDAAAVVGGAVGGAAAVVGGAVGGAVDSGLRALGAGGADDDEDHSHLEINTIRLGRGDYFAEYAIILEPNKSKHPATVRAITFCEMFTLKRDNFQGLLSYFPDLKESMLTLGRKRYEQMMAALSADTTFRKVASSQGGPADARGSDDTEKKLNYIDRSLDRVRNKFGMSKSPSAAQVAAAGDEAGGDEKAEDSTAIVADEDFDEDLAALQDENPMAMVLFSKMKMWKNRAQLSNQMKDFREMFIDDAGDDAAATPTVAFRPEPDSTCSPAPVAPAPAGAVSVPSDVSATLARILDVQQRILEGQQGMAKSQAELAARMARIEDHIQATR